VSGVGGWVARLVQARPRPMTAGWIGVDRVQPPPEDPLYHPPEPVTLEDDRGRTRVLIDGLGSINRALERDFLSFKTGDLTLQLRDSDGGMTALLDAMAATDRYELTLEREGALVFSGVLLGKGSISRHEVERLYEVTAYGFTKLLDEADGGLIRRTVPASWTLNGAHSGGATTINANESLTDLRTGDVLHITDHLNAEDVTVKQRTDADTVTLEAGLVHAYATGTSFTLKTPQHRYVGVEFLVRAAFAAAYIPVAELLLNKSLFGRLAPTPVNISGLSIANNPRRGMSQLALTYGSGYGRCQVSIAGVDSYTQENPDEAWIVQGLPDRGPYDWSPYFKQDGSIPQFLLNEPFGTSETAFPRDEHQARSGAADYFSSPVRIWGFYIDSAPTLSQRTSNDGNTWNAATHIALPGAPTALSYERTCDYDSVRHFVMASWKANSSSTRNFQYYDVDGGASWTDMKQADDDADTGYYGVRYIADLDITLALRQDGGSIGPVFEICAFRGATRLWKRPFPPCFIASDPLSPPISGNSHFYPTRTARYCGGRIYLTLISDGSVQLLWTDDEFQTYTMRKVVEGTNNAILMAARVVDNYRFFSYVGSVPRGYFIAAPYYAGVIEDADFAGKSSGEALLDLAAISGAAFWVDDEAQGHFVARDLLPGMPIVDITDLVMERSSVRQWDQASEYVEVSGAGGSAISGDAAFAADGFELNSAFVTNDALAQALADSLRDGLGGDRPFAEVRIRNPERIRFVPLQRVLLDGGRWKVYEVDDTSHEDEAVLKLLLDVEAA